MSDHFEAPVASVPEVARRCSDPRASTDEGAHHMNHDERWLDDLLLMALDDWVHIGDVMGAAMRASTDPQVVRSVAFGLGTQALVSGELIAGDLWDEFTPWPLTTTQSVSKLISKWLAAGWDPMPGQVAWFAITPTGRTAAERALARRAAAPPQPPQESQLPPTELTEPIGPNPFLTQLHDICRTGRADLTDVIAIATAATPDPTVIRDLTIGILAEGLIPGTLVVDPPGDGAAALARIITDWPATEPAPAGAHTYALAIG